MDETEEEAAPIAPRMTNAPEPFEGVRGRGGVMMVTTSRLLVPLAAPNADDVRDWIGAADLIAVVATTMKSEPWPLDAAARCVQRWARKGLIRARAAFFFRDEQRQDSGDIPKDFWEAASTLERVGDYFAVVNVSPLHREEWTIFDVAFARPDCEALGVRFDVPEIPQSQPAKIRALRGKLPEDAKPAARRDEEFAHRAAELVRAKVSLAEAIRRVRPADPARQEATIEYGIRRAFDLMYGKDGMPRAQL